MANRKKRARRHDTRHMTDGEYRRRWIERYRVAYLRATRSYEARHANSPYTAIERLRYP